MVKEKINSRRKVYKNVLDGNVDVWEDYCKLRKEVKDLGRMSEDSDFDSEWREQVKTKVSTMYV